jgi:CheY-like chemotaxis protein
MNLSNPSEVPLYPDTKKKKILVVDDELDMQIFLFNLLRSKGFDPINVEIGSEVLQIATEIKPALIILNAMMLCKGSSKVYCDLKQDKRLQNIPVIMHSIVDKQIFFYFQKFRSGTAGQILPEPDAFLIKPLEAEELLGLVETLTETGDTKTATDLRHE